MVFIHTASSNYYSQNVWPEGLNGIHYFDIGPSNLIQALGELYTAEANREIEITKLHIYPDNNPVSQTGTLTENGTGYDVNYVGVDNSRSHIVVIFNKLP